MLRKMSSPYYARLLGYMEMSQQSSVNDAMDAKYLRVCPLGIKAEQFFGLAEYNTKYKSFHDMDTARWKHAYTLFSRLETLQNTDQARWKDFAATLGPQQASAWSLLSEWVRGAYHPPQLAQAVRQALSEPAPKSRTSTGFQVEFPDSAILDSSVYQSELSQLYYFEFITLYKRGHIHYDLLLNFDHCRREAARWATCQRIAHATYAKFARLPDLPIPAIPLQDASQGVERAPWSDDDPKDSYYPKYLWSISQKGTIDCSGLASKPSYVCISHTWGRWRTKEMVEVVGIPWKIPQNTVFGAENIPAHLGGLVDQIDTDFVWFDLVCIPQTREGPMGVVAEREIAQQAAIFRGSTQCLAWFNYISSWKAEEHLIDWLSLQYLHLSTAPDLYQTEPHISRCWTLANENPPQLTRHPLHVQYLGREAFPTPRLTWLWRLSGRRAKLREITWNLCQSSSAWFSSLWTLQELSVCPHMVLMSRNWTPLRDASGSVFTLEKLRSLFTTVSVLMLPPQPGSDYQSGHQKHLIPENIEDAYPRAGQTLYHMFLDVEFPLGRQLTRVEIIIQGNRRYCTERRAEAIMSAIGVTDWFNPTCENEKDLVLGAYPIAFVREAAQKCGPEFALAHIEFEKPVRGRHGYLKRIRGSLLPFSPLDKRHRRGNCHMALYTLFFDLETVWNSTFDTWTFRQDGSVSMTTAAILGELTGDIASVIQPVEVTLCYQDSNGIVQEGREFLHTWLQRQSQDYWTFAVNISRNIGIILQGLRHKRLGHALVLVKRGAYQILANFADRDAGDWIFLQDLDWVPVQPVNWIIL
ncbi:hypothetical protein F5B21DRAFT_497348 [Xylaria acuta]|nr:hypothetical protein F5B21DRAFT_497348 [Xylaria acuta]